MSREFKIIVSLIVVVAALCLASVLAFNKVCLPTNEDFLIGASLSGDVIVIRLFGNPYICSLK